MKFHRDGTLPKNGEIFVFGSNLAGRHGAGAAKIAAADFGAVIGYAKGMVGRQAYGIPTKNPKLEVLPVEQIAAGAAVFLNFARKNLHSRFWVTRIGCGLAGYNNRVIAPLFRGAPDNCSFAQPWRPYLIDDDGALVEGRPHELVD